jgi:hypothetical protein
MPLLWHCRYEDFFDSTTGKCKRSSWNNENFLTVQLENVSAFHGMMIILIAQQENVNTLHGTMIIF